MAEIEFGVLAGDLPDRVGDRAASTRHQGLERSKERGGREGRLAIHHRRRAGETPQALPDNRRVTLC